MDLGVVGARRVDARRAFETRMDLVGSLVPDGCQARRPGDHRVFAAAGAKLRVDGHLPVDRKLQRADRAQRIGHRLHQRHFELAAAPPGRIHLYDVVDRRWSRRRAAGCRPWRRSARLP